jgi:ParB family transcriptional regulator, chromosome partitioning protein
MAEEASRLRLGRGLAALIGDVDDELGAVEKARGQRRVPIEFLRPNPRNPRRSFNEQQLQELALSVRQRGVIQPIIVRDAPGLPDVYEIIAGERRWRAAQIAGLHEVPVVVVEADDKTALEYAILENVQRTDLNAIEEAGGYERLMSEFGYSQGDLSQILGRSRSHVANMLRLLNLPEPIQQMVVDGRITAGHARALLSVRDPVRTAERIIDKGLNVREVERIAHSDQVKGDSTRGRPRREKDPDTRALERALEDVLGLTVTIEHRGQGGELRIAYRTLEQLDGLCRKLRDSAVH